MTFWMTSHWHHMAQMLIVDSRLSDRSTYPAWHEQSCARRVASIVLSRWRAKSPDEESFDSWSWYCYRMLRLWKWGTPMMAMKNRGKMMIHHQNVGSLFRQSHIEASNLQGGTCFGLGITKTFLISTSSGIGRPQSCLPGPCPRDMCNFPWK